MTRQDEIQARLRDIQSTLATQSLYIIKADDPEKWRKNTQRAMVLRYGAIWRFSVEGGRVYVRKAK